jgi:hydrogenase/urease accessory protein HupE
VSRRVVRPRWGDCVFSLPAPASSVAGTRAARLLVLVVTCWFSFGLFAEPAAAHSMDTLGFSQVTRTGEDVRYDLIVDYAAFITVAGIRQPGETALAASARQLWQGREKARAYLDQRLQVLVDGVRCDLAIRDTGVERRFAEPYARISLLYDCPGEGEYEIRYSVLVGDLDPGHSNVMTYDLGGGSGTFVFHRTATEFTAGEASASRQALRFTALGLDHILGGLDHLLFVVALLVGSRNARDVLGVITAFTLAHSVTLALTVTGVLSLPASVVEPLIALSIAYVAAQSALGSPSRYRLVAVFGFGLLHGMGFAGALELGDELTWSWLLSLVTFNLGIEFGQAAVVAALLPLLVLLRRFTWSRHVQIVTTGAIAVCGLTWFIQRLLLV